VNHTGEKYWSIVKLEKNKFSVNFGISRNNMKSILDIEDDISILRGLKDNLEYEGYKVTSRTDGKKGLILALEKSFDLLLLDIMSGT